MDSGKSEPESILCWFPNLGSYSLGTLTLKIPFSARTGHVGSPATCLGTQTDFFRGSPKKGVVSKRGYSTEITRGYGQLNWENDYQLL